MRFIRDEMGTFIAFRTAVMSVLKPTPIIQPIYTRSQQARSLSQTSPANANGSGTQPKAKFNRNAFIDSQLSRATRTTRPGKPKGPLKDEDIKHPYVQISHDGRLSVPTTIPHILSLIDRRGYYLLLANSSPPIVKLVNKSEEFARKKQEQEQARLSKARQTHKEVQLSWGLGEADADHKLGKAREELEKGLRVDLVFVYRKGQPVLSEEQMREKVQAVVDSLADVGKEWKERQFQRRTGAVFLQSLGPVNPSTQQENATLQEGQVEETLTVKKKGKKPRKNKDAKKEQDMEESKDTKKSKYKVKPIPQEIWDLFQ
ncbi:hypothetical protein AX17_004941 [Amanita inopinata Kibby_2008]|nr:hypothetical protein AX17_004941 [Amanita inopinata Kibby_2008]